MENYKHLYEQARLMVEKYQDEIIPGFRDRLERAERERDTAVKDIPKSCATCKEFEGGSCPILSYKDYQTDCEHWKWRGTKED